MKKWMIIALSFISGVVLVSCINEVHPVDFGSKAAEKIGKSVRGAVDPEPFFDVTMKNINAYEVKLSDFESMCSGRYRNKDSYITVNGKDHTVSYQAAKVEIGGKEYSNVFLKYEYEIKAAGENVIYLCPKETRNLKVKINNSECYVKDVGNFCSYISMYGFGMGRIEVSKHLNDVSLVKKGTYWKAD